MLLNLWDYSTFWVLDYNFAHVFLVRDFPTLFRRTYASAVDIVLKRFVNVFVYIVGYLNILKVRLCL